MQRARRPIGVLQGVEVGPLQPDELVLRDRLVRIEPPEGAPDIVGKHHPIVLIDGGVIGLDGGRIAKDAQDVGGRYVDVLASVYHLQRGAAAAHREILVDDDVEILLARDAEAPKTAPIAGLMVRFFKMTMPTGAAAWCGRLRAHECFRCNP
jgi:hypothetical protein